MSEKAVLTLNGNTPDAAEVMDFFKIMFGTDWPCSIEDKIREFANLVYSVTRRADFTVYQDAEINPYLQQGRIFAAVFDEACGKWIVIVARGEEYSGMIGALRFISQLQHAGVQ
jgi:hypothetical protein